MNPGSGDARRVVEDLADRFPGLAERIQLHLPVALEALRDLYGEAAVPVAERAVEMAAAAAIAMPEPVRREPWSESDLGAVCYVDRFAGDLPGLVSRLGYLEELGVTYLHVMPPFRTPPGGGDGGYAVSTYRETDPRLGSIDDLRRLAAACAEKGITLAMDVVCNHTADDHPWARAAAAGDPEYGGFYFIYSDRQMPDRWEATLREIFPQVRRGSFTEVDGVGWVWTTFHSFQWDLNYSNPAVFTAMFGEMLFLARLGAGVLRLDAVPFLWKEEGTPSENLPQVHFLLRAWRALMRIAAPGIVFKSEAIVHPDAVRSYMGVDECELSYNPVFMVSLWEALATGRVELMAETIRRRVGSPPGTVWIEYMRSHDDIGWGFADEDAAAVGYDGFEHRQWLNRFYTGMESGSWARGLPFQFNPENLDMRISGAAASLCGIEQALAAADPSALELAESRLQLLFSMIMSIGGVPLIYLGDEIATRNDYSYEQEHPGDSRWVHRPVFDWEEAAGRHDQSTLAGRTFTTVRRLAAVRSRRAAFAPGSETEVVGGTPPGVIALRKKNGGDRVLVVANFTAELVTWPVPEAGTDVLTGARFGQGEVLGLKGYGFSWLVEAAGAAGPPPGS